MTIDGNHIKADEGKVFRRKGTDEIFGEEIYLGYSHYIGGVLQRPPHLDTPEDFEEVDMPEGYMNPDGPESPQEPQIDEQDGVE